MGGVFLYDNIIYIICFKSLQGVKGQRQFINLQSILPPKNIPANTGIMTSKNFKYLLIQHCFVQLSKEIYNNTLAADKGFNIKPLC